jgi:hypothetical protein
MLLVMFDTRRSRHFPTTAALTLLLGALGCTAGGHGSESCLPAGSPIGTGTDMMTITCSDSTSCTETFTVTFTPQ